MEKYVLIIILTTVGFFLLAAILLVPVWRFLGREEEESRRWRTPRNGEDGQAPQG